MTDISQDLGSPEEGHEEADHGRCVGISLYVSEGFEALVPQHEPGQLQ